MGKRLSWAKYVVMEGIESAHCKICIKSFSRKKETLRWHASSVDHKGHGSEFSENQRIHHF